MTQNTNTNTSNTTRHQAVEVVNDHIRLAAVDFTVSLGKGATHSQAMKAIDTVCSHLHRSEVSTEKLRMLLGRLAVVVSDNRLYEPEYTSFEQYTQAMIAKHHLSRATFRDAMMIARRLPNLTQAQAESVPMTSLTLVARAAKDAKPAQVDKLLKDAATLPPADLRNKVAAMGLIGGGPDSASSSPTMIIRFTVTREVGEQWSKLVADRDANQVFADAVLLLASKQVFERGKPTSKRKAA